MRIIKPHNDTLNMDEENRKTQGVKPLFVKTNFSIQQASQNIKNALQEFEQKGYRWGRTTQHARMCLPPFLTSWVW